MVDFRRKRVAVALALIEDRRAFAADFGLRRLIRREQIAFAEPQDLGTRVAEQPQRRAIGVDDAFGIGVKHYDRVARLRKELAISFLAVAPRLFEPHAFRQFAPESFFARGETRVLLVEFDKDLHLGLQNLGNDRLIYVVDRSERIASIDMGVVARTGGDK